MFKKQPIIKIPYKPLWKYIDIICVFSIACTITYVLLNYTNLPEQIPEHYNIRGEADSYGSKSSLWVLPIISVFQFILLSLLSKYPHTFNYTVKITDANAAKQYEIGLDMMAQLKLTLVLFLSFLTYRTIQIAINEEGTMGLLPVWILPLALGAIIIRSIYLSNAYK